MTNFDLTTKSGFAEIASFLIRGHILQNPYYALAKMILDAIFGGKPEELLQRKKEIIEAAIRKGKENGVKEMTIETENVRGLKFETPPIEGVQIAAVVGHNDKMVIHVKYK